MSALFRSTLLLAAALPLCACQKNYTAYALTSTGSIIEFDTGSPTSIIATETVSGLASGETLVQIAYRPEDDTLYGITSDNLLCTVDPGTGVATLVSSTAFSSDTLSSPAIDFDPVLDQLRVITTEYNLRVASDGTLVESNTKLAFDSDDTYSGDTPQIAAITYANPDSGATSTTLYALDVTTQSLLRVGNAAVSTSSSADSGDLHTIGSIGVSFTADAGLSIRSGSDTAYAALQQSGSGAALYTIDLSDGAAAEVGLIGGGDQTLISLALVPGS